MPGPDLTYLRFVSERPEVVKAFHDAYGDQPKQLTVYLPYKTVEENFTSGTWKEEWSASVLVRRCDGDHIVQWYDKPSGQQRFEQKPCLRKCGGKCKCDDVGRLRVVLPDLIRAGHIGLVTVLTTSLNDIVSLQDSLDAAAAASPAGLIGMPFLLWRQPTKIGTPDDKSKTGRARRVKSLLRIAPAAQWVQAQLLAAERRSYAALEGVPVAALPAPSLPAFDTDTGEIDETDIEEAEPDDPEDGEYNLPPAAPEWSDPDQPEPEVEAPPVTAASLRKEIEGLLAKKGKKLDAFKSWLELEHHIKYDKASIDELVKTMDLLTQKKAS